MVRIKDTFSLLDNRIQILIILAIIIFTLLLLVIPAESQDPAITLIATDLQNPRGVAFLPDGRLVVAQAGTGLSTGDDADNSGKLSILEDLNNDGDYLDAGEVNDVLDKMPGYNILYQFNPGRDEIVGMGDVIALSDGRVYFTLDDNFEALSVVELTANLETVGHLIERPGSMNSILYDDNRDVIFIAESTINAIGAVTLDGEFRTITNFGLLANEQQAVPSGLALDPNTGDLLVTLFSGQLWVYYSEILSFMVGDAKVVRVDPETGDYEDEITGLTTAVDVATDEIGNIYVAELTTQWATTMLNQEFDLFDPDAPPDAGGYARFTGRVTLYPSNGDQPQILVDNLDQPTNLTYHDGNLYVSVGQGTPNRPIWSPETGLTRIVGQIYRIDLSTYQN